MNAAKSASINATKSLITLERFRSKMYYDPAGVPTIGYGTAIDTAEEIWLMTATITPEQGMQLLLKDMKWVNSSIQKYINAPLNQNQFDALASLVYNIGETEFRKAVNLRSVINNSASISEIEMRFKKFIYAGGKKRQFLIDRRNIEWKLWITPVTA